MQIGDEYLDSKEFKDVLKAYEDSVRLDQAIFMDLDDLIDIADYYNYTGNKDKAYKVVEIALELNPGAAPPLVFKAREALSIGNIMKAKSFAESITDKDDPDYIYLQVEILVAQDEIEEAEECLGNFFDTISDNEHDDFFIDTASMYMEYGVYDKAYDWIKLFEETSRDDYKDLMGRVLMAVEKYGESIVLFNELIDNHPYVKRYWTCLANAQFLNEDYNDSITSCEYAMAIDPSDVNCLLTKANCLYKIKNFEAAIECYQRYCKTRLPDGYIEMNMGMCWLNLAKYEEAISHLKRALSPPCKVSGNDSIMQIYRDMALAYNALNMTDDAIECVETLQEIDNVDIAETYLLHGHILLGGDDEEEAKIMFRKAIIKSKNSPHIVLRVIVSLYDNKYVEIAYQMFKRFFSIIYEDFNEGFAYMALCCWDLKKTDEFFYYLKTATIRNPQETQSVLGHLFPESIRPEDYYSYIHKQLNRK